MDKLTTLGNPATRRVAGVLIGAALLISGCATPPENDPAAMETYRQANDQAEPFNRTVFDVNMGLDKAVLKPISYVYKETVPLEGRQAVTSFLDNLRTPVIFANDLMQGEARRAWTTLVRFVANSTFGIGGLIDVAADMGYAKHDEDFGQTLAVWGVGDGSYLMLPLFGPSNPRDAIGRVVDIILDPMTWFAPNYLQYARFGTEAVDSRTAHYNEIEDLEKNSLDFYAAVRSLYRQKRTDEIRNGVPTATPFGPSPTGAGAPMELPDQKASDEAQPGAAAK